MASQFIINKQELCLLEVHRTKSELMGIVGEERDVWEENLLEEAA